MVASYSSRFRAATPTSRKRQAPDRTSSSIRAATYSVSANMLSARHSSTPPQSPSYRRKGPKKQAVRCSRAVSGSRGDSTSTAQAEPQSSARRTSLSRARTLCSKISRPLPSPSRVTVTDRAVRSRISMSFISWAVKYVKPSRYTSFPAEHFDASSRSTSFSIRSRRSSPSRHSRER